VMRVSVVMPARNAAATIGAAIGSVLAQTFGELELVVVDDGSEDETAAIAEAHAGAVRVLRQAHAGVAAARNRGIEEARGELIAFCDADDVLLPLHIDELVRLWERHGGIVTGNAYLLFPGGIHPRKLRFRRGFPAPDAQRRAILEQNFVSIMSVFPRTLVHELGPFREDLRSAEDWDFWLRAVFAGTRVTLQPRPLALLRWGAGLSADRERMDDDVDAVLRSALENLPLDGEERAYVELRLAEPGPRRLARAAERALRAGDYRAAARDFRRAAALMPSERMLVWKARALSTSPALVGRLARARQRRLDRRLGFGEEQLY
jgi:glycosyltransferase involved in cell wall biosynthesis